MKRRAVALMLIGLLGTMSTATAEKRVALVFDDGPKPGDAGPLITLLEREKIPATFSLVGQRVIENPDTARAVCAGGFEIVNHSLTHAHPDQLDDAALDREIAEAQRVIRDAVGVAPKWYWPPYLEGGDRVRSAAKRAGLAIYIPRHLVVSMDYDTERASKKGV